MVRSVLLAAALCALTPAFAYAQLYSWTDPGGRLIISDQPRDPAAKTYLVFGRAVANTAAASTPDAAPGDVTATTAQPISFGATKPASAQASVYDDLITEHAAAHALNPDFVRAVIQAESAFNPWARSPKGAMGLMQLMPHTASVYRVLNAYNPAENIRAGVAYLKSLMTRYNDDVSLALAAYNAGPNAVEKYGRKVPPYKETRKYVARIKKDTEVAAPAPPPNLIYRITRIVNGHETVSYSNKPSPGAVLVTNR
jgi:soluble lytic murein transglycosylase-like protein